MGSPRLNSYSARHTLSPWRPELFAWGCGRPNRPMSRRQQRFGDSRLGEGVLTVWQAVTEFNPSIAQRCLRSSDYVFEV
jgi:hypothetical protein